MATDAVAKLLDDIGRVDPARLELVQRLREIIRGLDPAISEDVKYGGFLFSVGKPFCGVFSYAKHVSLEFSHGASLPDTFGALEGEGKLRRHIKLAGVRDISDKHIREYLAMALQAALKR